jgi:uncharacterized protein YkwD
MGVESRDWYREEAGEREAAVGRRGTVAFAVLVLVACVAVALRAGGVFAGERGTTVVVAPLFGPTLTIEGPLYPSGDPWRSYLADERTCPGGEDAKAPLPAQAQTMVCLIDYARSRAGLASLPVSATLSASARLKGDDILRCGVFAHSPCGEEPSTGVRGLGYEGRFGENLYVADGRFGAPRVALDGWLNSPGHRENLLRPEWRVQSLYVVKAERFREYRGATVWVSHFGDR